MITAKTPSVDTGLAVTLSTIQNKLLMMATCVVAALRIDMGAVMAMTNTMANATRVALTSLLCRSATICKIDIAAKPNAIIASVLKVSA